MSRSNSLYVFCLFLSYYNFYFFFREKGNAFNPNIILHDKNEHINGGSLKIFPEETTYLVFSLVFYLTFFLASNKNIKKKNKTKQKKEEALFIGGGSYVL